MKMTEHKSSDTINIKELRIEKLSENNLKFTEVFDCGDDDLNEFLKDDAFHYQKGKIAVTYLCFYMNVLVGYYSLSNDAIEIKGKAKKILDKLKKRQRTYPAIKIGRLGIDKNFSRIGIGTKIIDVIVGCARVHSNSVGCRYASVNAYNQPEVVAFYKKNNFKILKITGGEEGDTLLMYRDIIESG